MSEAVLDSKQWGNSLGVRLPASVAREAHVRVDQRVRVSVEGGQVVITPVPDAPLTLRNYSGGLGCSLLGRKRNFIGQDTRYERCMISYCP